MQLNSTKDLVPPATSSRDVIGLAGNKELTRKSLISDSIEHIGPAETNATLPVELHSELTHLAV